MSSFRDQLREGMEARNWKPVQLAAAMAERGTDISVVTVERWLDGANEPRYSLAQCALAALGLQAHTEQAVAP